GGEEPHPPRTRTSSKGGSADDAPPREFDPDGRLLLVSARAADRLADYLDRSLSTASPAWAVDRLPPTSRVVSPFLIAAATAASIRSPTSTAPRCRAIIAALRMAPIGFTMPLPAMSGALPCTGSNRPRPVRGLMF